MKRSRNSSTHANRTIWSANDQSNWTHIFVCICVCVCFAAHKKTTLSLQSVMLAGLRLNAMKSAICVVFLMFSHSPHATKLFNVVQQTHPHNCHHSHQPTHRLPLDGISTFNPFSSLCNYSEWAKRAGSTDSRRWYLLLNFVELTLARAPRKVYCVREYAEARSQFTRKGWVSRHRHRSASSPQLCNVRAFPVHIRTHRGVGWQMGVRCCRRRRFDV